MNLLLNAKLVPIQRVQIVQCSICDWSRVKAYEKIPLDFSKRSHGFEDKQSIYYTNYFKSEQSKISGMRINKPCPISGIIMIAGCTLV